MLPLLSSCCAREKPKAMASPSATPLLTMAGVWMSKLKANAAEEKERNITTKLCTLAQ